MEEEMLGAAAKASACAALGKEKEPLGHDALGHRRRGAGESSYADSEKWGAGATKLRHAGESRSAMRGAQSSTRDTDTLEICSLSLGVAVEEEKQEQEGRQ